VKPSKGPSSQPSKQPNHCPSSNQLRNLFPSLLYNRQNFLLILLLEYQAFNLRVFLQIFQHVRLQFNPSDFQVYNLFHYQQRCHLKYPPNNLLLSRQCCLVVFQLLVLLVNHSQYRQYSLVCYLLQIRHINRQDHLQSNQK
jgi:hypothetical protein